jgi:hypothetical protein
MIKMAWHIACTDKQETHTNSGNTTPKKEPTRETIKQIVRI